MFLLGSGLLFFVLLELDHEKYAAIRSEERVVGNAIVSISLVFPRQKSAAACLEDAPLLKVSLIVSHRS